MILLRLVVENFRPYKGKTDIRFAASQPQNVTVLKGLNGTGKSSLFMALKWCFWGEAGVEQRDLASTTAIRTVSPGASVETRVEVTYEHQGTTFRAIRSFRTRVGAPLPSGEPSYSSEPTSQFHLYRISAKGDATPIDTVHDEIGRAVPKEALDYFFFDAEQITRFADDGNGSHVKNAVKRVLRFDELESAARHVDEARKEYARKLRNVAGPDASDLVKRREEVVQAADGLRAEVLRIGEELDNARSVNDGYVNRLEELASVTKLSSERTEVLGRLGSLETAYSDALASMQANLGSLAFALADGAFREAKATVEAKRRKGEIPAKVKTQVLKDWLETSTCLCGRPLEPGTQPWAEIHSHLDRGIPSRTEDELTVLGSSIDLCVREGAAKKDQVTLDLARLSQARDMTQIQTDRLRQLESELGSHPDEDVAKIAANAQRSREAMTDLAQRKVTLQLELQQKDSEVEQLANQVKKVEFSNQEAKRLETRQDLASRTVAALRDLRENFESDVRRDIEAATSDLFPKLIWKPDYYSGVTLSPEFRLEALDPYGDPAFSIGGTSMGEARVLSLAFIVAMQVVARDSIDARAPAVVDSPFGNLSVAPIQKICTELPALVDQIVLFLTEADWQWAEGPLAPRLGAQYEITYDPIALMSTVVAVEV